MKKCRVGELMSVIFITFVCGKEMIERGGDRASSLCIHPLLSYETRHDR